MRSARSATPSVRAEAPPSPRDRGRVSQANDMHDEADYIVVGAGSPAASSPPTWRTRTAACSCSGRRHRRTRLCTVQDGVDHPHHPPGQEAVRLGLLHGAAEERGEATASRTSRGKRAGRVEDSINGMVYVRGQPQELRRLARRGLHGLGVRRRRCAAASASRTGAAPSDHRGAGGPIAVTRSKDLVPASEGASSARSPRRAAHPRARRLQQRLPARGRACTR